MRSKDYILREQRKVRPGGVFRARVTVSVPRVFLYTFFKHRGPFRHRSKFLLAKLVTGYIGNIHVYRE